MLLRTPLVPATCFTGLSHERDEEAVCRRYFSHGFHRPDWIRHRHSAAADLRQIFQRKRVGTGAYHVSLLVHAVHIWSDTGSTFGPHWTETRVAREHGGFMSFLRVVRRRIGFAR